MYPVTDIKKQIKKAGIVLVICCVAVGAPADTDDSRQYGPASQMTPLIISEIMYNPLESDTNCAEFVELYNSEPLEHDIGGYRFSGEIDYIFPPDTTIAPNGYLVVAADPAHIETLNGISGVLGPFSNRLSNSGGTLRLRNRQNAICQEVRYSPDNPWPIAADGAGHSLVLAYPDLGEADPDAWRASALRNGNPGTNDISRTDTLSKLVINEFLAHTDPPLLDYIEIYNTHNAAVSIAGCYLTDNPVTNKYMITTPTISAGDYLVFTEVSLGFLLDPGGETIYLVDPTSNYVIDAVRFSAQSNSMSSGRYPDGSPDIQALSSRTPNAGNTAPYEPDIIINEIMFHPISESNNDKYIELYNRGGSPVDLSYWRFTDGIDYMIPSGTLVQAGEYLVIAENHTNLIARYTQLNTTNTIGDYGGDLSHRGERIILARPDNMQLPYRDFVTVDEVTYNDGWGTWSDAGGSSLELVDPRSDNGLKMNWADSDETAKSSWTIVTNTGLLDWGSTTAYEQMILATNNADNADEVQIMLADAGECLLDSVDVHKSGGPNLLINGSFESGTSSWVIQGNHRLSVPVTGGAHSGVNSLHLRASGRGDNAVNRIESDLQTTLHIGESATITAWARWLRGNPVLIARFHHNHLEAAGILQVPQDLGTPGAPNSRLIANSAPSIRDVIHSPLLPAAMEDIVVKARVSDNDGLTNVRLGYRVDPTPAYTWLAMNDAGTSGDETPGDGYYAATIPGQASGQLVAFSVEATDGYGPTATRFYPEDSPTNECLVLFGQSSLGGTLSTLRFWITADTRNTWQNRQVLSDEFLGGTLIHNDCRIIYGASGRFSGSPWGRQARDDPETWHGHCVFHTPKDDRLLGRTGVNMHSVAGDDSFQREKLLYWTAEQIDIPYLNQRFVNFFINGTRKKLYTAIQQVNNGYTSAWFPRHKEGIRHKVDCWFEFDDGQNSPAGDVKNTFRSPTGSVGDIGARLALYTILGGTTKQARYRWHFWKETSIGRVDDDYSTLITLTEALNANASAPDYGPRLRMLVDVQNWSRILAFRELTCTWDAQGSAVGKNGFMFKPEDGPWQLTLWDMSQGMGQAGPWFPNSQHDAPLLSGVEDTMLTDKFFAHPPFRRMFYATVKDAIEGPMIDGTCGPEMDEYYNLLVVNGITDAKSPDEDSSAANIRQLRAWVEARRAYLATQLAAVDASFAITSNGGSPFSTGNSVVTIDGTAPVEVTTLTVNGRPYTATFSTVTSWSIEVGLDPGLNALTIVGLDRSGNIVDQDSIDVTYTGSAVSPEGLLVINEIMYNPTNGLAEFVEIVNLSSTYDFDLDGFRLQGVDFTFDGTTIGADEYIVVVRDNATYAATYSNATSVAGEYPGVLDNGGETLRLLMPLTTNTWQTIDEVRFDQSPPWPVQADGAGPSLQLIDAAEDNARCGNWGVDTVMLATPGEPNSIAMALPAFDELWINEIMPNNTVYTDNAGEYEPWAELHNAGNPVNLQGSSYYLTDDCADLTRWAFPSGWTINSDSHLLVWCDGEIGETTSTNLHAGFDMNTVTGCVVLTRIYAGTTMVVDYVDYYLPEQDNSYGRYPEGTGGVQQVFHYPTPGSANNPASEPATIYINEWMARNSMTIFDPTDGDFDDWFELYNAGAEAVDLTGFKLTDGTNFDGAYSIRAGNTIAANDYLLVWADNETGQNGPDADIHVNFRLASTGDTIRLYAPDGTMLDQVAFNEQSENIGEGRWPNGSPDIFDMPIFTPGASNRLFHFTALTLTNSFLTLKWNTQEGEQYRIYSTDSLSTGTWTLVNTVDMRAVGPDLTTNMDISGHTIQFFKCIQAD